MYENMKKWLKIFFITFSLIVIFALIAVAITLYQVKGIIAIAKDQSIQQDFDTLMKGDCSKLPVIDAKYADIKTKIKYACYNPILKILIEKMETENTGFCSQIDNNEFENNLTKIREYCQS